ncbi:hypothetical protein E6O75_ATG05904 [Venturia nashicola]|uniref:Uncharacterized protein n=2 Tax=Venturia nashicola TaxID=86259 RepID=A0A4Z1PCD6_9PEZI|nr:hypothetical protein E6O75_ATG05904 [Venturia nashicola]
MARVQHHDDEDTLGSDRYRCRFWRLVTPPMKPESVAGIGHIRFPRNSIKQWYLLHFAPRHERRKKGFQFRSESEQTPDPEQKIKPDPDEQKNKFEVDATETI